MTVQLIEKPLCWIATSPWSLLLGGGVVTEFRVLTTIPGNLEKFWGANTTLADSRCGRILYGRMGVLAQHWLALRIAIRMLSQRAEYDVVVIDGGPIGQWFSWLQSATRRGRVPTVMIDCLWYRSPSRLIQAIKRFHKKMSAISTDLFVVWAEHEVDDYAAEFDIHREKFAYLPFHNTLDGYTIHERDDGFVFAGGNGDRDYSVLIEAVRGTDIPVLIATTNHAWLSLEDVPPNVSIRGVSHDEFRENMASCTLAVVPMMDDLLHSGGQQTFLNSMCCGKPTVVVGEKAAAGYISDGKDGVIVDYGDVTRLREVLLELWSTPDRRAEIGRNGRKRAEKMTTQNFMSEVYALAVGVVNKQHSGLSSVAE